MEAWTRTAELWPISDIIPYENNAKLQNVGWIINTICIGLPDDITPEAKQAYIIDKLVDQPIVVDKKGYIIKGHGRRKAAVQLGLTHFPVILRNDYTPEQARLARLADNRSSEGGYDADNVSRELDELMQSMPEVDFEGIGMGDEWLNDLSLDDTEHNDREEEPEEPYSREIESPVYDIQGTKPSLVDLVNTDKSDSIISTISSSHLSEDEKEFLTRAAYRHDVFDYGKIAEYYANSESDIQNYFEDSTLVIIDFDKAIEQGYSKMSKELEAQCREDLSHDEA